MPIFTEGHDPPDAGLDPSQPAGRMPTGTPEPAPFSGPGAADIVGAAFRQNNPVVSVFDAITRSRPDMTPVPGYDAVQRLKGTENDDLIDQSLADVNPAQTDARIAKKQAEIKDQQTMAASGRFGTVASIAAGALDPSWFVPIVGELHAGAELGVAARIALGAGEGAVKSAISETGLQASQVTRTARESVESIATNTILMGLLGGGISMLSRRERAVAADGLDKVRTDLSPPKVEPGADGLPADTGSSPTIVPDHETDPHALTSDLSAAASDQRSMKLSRILLPQNLTQTIREIPIVGAIYDWTAAITMRFSPTLRIFSSDSLVAKRAMGDMAETSLRFTQSEAGVTTARGGIPLDRIVKMQTFRGRMENSHILRDAFVEYRGLEDKSAPIIRSQVEDWRGHNSGPALDDAPPPKMSYDDFKTEVSLAMSNGDVHPVTQVQSAARMIRQKVLDPVKALAQRTIGPDGKPMLGEVLEAPAGDKSYFPRVWNKQAIAANFNGAKKIFADWLENEQANKRASQQKLGLYQGALESHRSTIDKLQGQIEKLSGDTDVIAARQEETTRINKAANQRATKLRNTEQDTLPLKNAQGGAVFETLARNRGNLLADRASAKLSEIETLEERLHAEIENHHAMRAKIETEIGTWEGKSATAAKSALKARAEAEKGIAEQKEAGTYKGKDERLSSADKAVDKAVRKILKSDRDLSREDMESRAKEIINRINAAPDGRLPYDIAGSGVPAVNTGAQDVRGALNARDFAIPTAMVKDFVNTDTEHVIAAHLRTMLPDIHLTDRFGDIEMTDVFRRLDEEYGARIADAKTAKQQTSLDSERKSTVRDLAATRDRIRGIYGFELAKTQPNAARIANVARNWNLITDLGTSVFNRLTDSTNAVWRHGFMNVFGDGYAPFLKSMVGLGDGFGGAARQSMKDMSVGIDSSLGHLSHQWGDVIDNHLPGSKFERALAWSADKSMMVNLHGPWTDAMKTVAGTVAAADFLRTAERVSLGTHTAQDTQRLAQAGIAPHMADRIWKTYQDGGGQEFGKGTHVANTADWKDTHARDVFTAAIARDADMAVLTPGLEKPLWMSSPVVSLLGQYKSFVAAAHEKVLISNLQQMDGRTLQGLVAAMGMGMISYRAYTLWSGAEVSDRPQDWIKEGISRSAIGGWYTELNSVQAKFTGGNTDMFRAIGADHPLSRRQSNSALSEMLGPTYSRMEGLKQGLNDASHGTWTAMDTHKVRQAMWLQNLFLTRRLLDSVEDGFNESLGVKPLNRDPALWPTH